MNQPICKCKNLRVGFLYFHNYQSIRLLLVFVFRLFAQICLALWLIYFCTRKPEITQRLCREFFEILIQLIHLIYK